MLFRLTRHIKAGLYDSVLEIVRQCDVLKKDGIIILEHPSRLEINIDGFELIKKKIYSDKCITFLRLSNQHV